jgi:HNH endonuclease
MNLLKARIFDTPWGPMSRRELRSLLCEAQNWRCCYCGEDMTDPPAEGGRGHRLTDASVEHFIPRTRGCPDAWWNCVAACVRCNSSRPRDMAPLDYFRRRETVRAAMRRQHNWRKHVKWRAKKKMRQRRRQPGHELAVAAQ